MLHTQPDNMIHQHNQSEHDAIMDIAQQIKTSVNDLYVNHHNGDEKLNKRIKVLNDQAVRLIDRLEAHVKNTQPMDDIVKAYGIQKKCLLWLAGIGGSVLTGVVLNYLTR